MRFSIIWYDNYVCIANINIIKLNTKKYQTNLYIS